MASGMHNQLESQLQTVTKIVEEQVDAEIQRLENLDSDDLDQIRQQRVLAIRKQAQQKQQWLAQGHGEYTELTEEKEFFEATKKSENVVCHFYRDSAFRCKIVDKHLDLLAKKHLEAKFCKINVERAPFLTDRLKVRVIPTILLVGDAKTKDYIVGFSDLGNRDDFSTEMMAWRIAQAGVIHYSGDLLHPPDEGKSSSRQNPLLFPRGKKTIRGKESDDDDEDD